MIVLASIPIIMSFICGQIASEFTGVRYSKPLRLNAERYRRIQGLSVNEVDPSGENLEMVLNNLREKEQKHFRNGQEILLAVSFRQRKGWTCVYFGEGQSYEYQRKFSRYWFWIFADFADIIKRLEG